MCMVYWCMYGTAASVGVCHMGPMRKDNKQCQIMMNVGGECNRNEIESSDWI